MTDIKLELNKIQDENIEFVLSFIKNYTFHLFFDNEIELSKDFIKNLNHEEQKVFIKIIRKIRNTKKDELINYSYFLAENILKREHLTEEIEIISTKIYSDIEKKLLNIEKKRAKKSNAGLQEFNINSQLINNYSFYNFVEGDCNRLARSAGLAVSENPGKTAFNPLFVYSQVGLGKTHLAHAIGLQIKNNFPEKVVLNLQTSTFTHQIIGAVRNNNINDFVQFYQMIDVLIMDDIQFLEGKEKSQEIFFNVFNSLFQNNKQIIITSNKTPMELKGMEPRLLSRFKWGLAADLQIPDLETRIAILQNKLYNDGIEMPYDVIEYLAYSITTNIREMEGALVSILAQSTFSKKTIKLEWAKRVIDKFVKNTTRKISIDYIQKVVCDYFNLPVEAINSKTRKREIIKARQLAMYFAKQYSNFSLRDIGNEMGNIDSKEVNNVIQNVEVDIRFKEAKEKLAILFKQ